MSPRQLLVDCGNSASKWAVVESWSETGPQLSPVQRLPQDAAAEAAALQEVLTRYPQLRHCLICPGHQQRAQHLRHWLGQQQPQLHCRVLGDSLAVPDLGHYPGCGLDRLCAGVAAVAQARSAVLVVDAGTATTISAWLPSDQAQGLGRFAGGLILPGAAACAQGLHQAAPALPCVSHNLLSPADLVASDALAQSTQAALRQALAIGYPAMVESCVAQVAAASGAARVLLCGGAQSTLSPDQRRRWPQQGDLTLSGLARLAQWQDAQEG